VRMNGELPDGSTVMPSLCDWICCQLSRYQAASSSACCGSAMMASVARIVRSQKVRLSAVLVNQIRSVPGTSTSARSAVSWAGSTGRVVS
jgi:hypothetical protein